MRKYALVLLCVVAMGFWAHGEVQMTGPLPASWLTDMLHLGSGNDDRIQNGDISIDYLTGAGGEANVRPAPDQTIAGITGATEDPMVWTALHDDDGNWSCNADQYVSYWHVYVISPDEHAVT
ncbi:MAG TPA: hypothetical protein VM223_16500, partial [Planctomycetota bacterium]|nr:hypothetical protein [Planctomycetota bacterium]